MTNDYDLIVIGAGHAGIEAALAASRMGCSVLVLNLTLETIGLMSCNPAIGGTAKGHLVKEVDALGGVMGMAADRACIHFRLLNRSKGPAVRSSRAQCDRDLYRRTVLGWLAAAPGVHLRQGMVGELIVEGGVFRGVREETGIEHRARACVVAAGTFLGGLIHIGRTQTPAGRAGECPAVGLSRSLAALGLTTRRLKTGTPPRLERRSIDLDRLERQEADERFLPFSHRTRDLHPPRLPCFVTHTGEKTHRLVRDNILLSPLYGGAITGIGARYCPSFEDKVMRFPGRASHQVTLEPEGLDSGELYAKGLGNSFPPELQEVIVRSVPGLEEARIVRPAYAIEYDIVEPTQLEATLQTRGIRGLYLAGQINGTSGYEEAAAQGIWAGINAVLGLQGRPPFLPDRAESYAAVMVDDLVTRGTDEPYRMFTSRAEHRLLLREDNADLRLTPRAWELGLVDSGEHERVMEKARRTAAGLATLETARVRPWPLLNEALVAMGTAPLAGAASARDLLARPGVTLALLREGTPELLDLGGPEVDEQLELHCRYDGYIRRQEEAVERMRRMESLAIPPGIDYEGVHGLSTEVRQKLQGVRPRTLGQAGRVPGITPAAVAILLIYLEGRRRAQREPAGEGR